MELRQKSISCAKGTTSGHAIRLINMEFFILLTRIIII